MQLLGQDSDESRASKVLTILLSLLFLVAPFYYQDNLGGEGLNLPFNAVVWLPVLFIIAGAIFKIIESGEWVRPNYLWLILAMPIGLYLTGFVSGMDRPGEWLIRLGVVFGGIALWFSVLQYRLSEQQMNQLLYLLLASMLIHALVGLVQMISHPLFRGWVPISSGNRLLGMFQQPNLQASLMATAVALALWLATTKTFSEQRWPQKSALFLTLFLASLEVAASGSRVGLIGAVLALLLICVGRIKALISQPLLAIALAFTLGTGAIAGYQANDGALQAYNKIEKLAEEGKDARPHIYRIAYDVFERSPLFGHGIGSFQSEFQKERVTYYQTTDASAVDGSPRFSHPHNELLFWMDEGGLVALLAIGIAVLGVVLQLIRLGWGEGLALAALLLPIALHTQTELPFYISTYHWILLTLLLAVLFSHRTLIKPVKLSLGATALLKGSPLVIVPIMVLFLVHSLLSQTGIMQYYKHRGTEPTHLRFALNNVYFKELGEYFVMRSSLYGAIEHQDQNAVLGFIEWGEAYLEQIPDIQLYRDVAIARQNIGDEEGALALIDQAKAIYPKDRSIEDTHRRLEAGEQLVTSSLALLQSEE
ncbi:O-Antigen ligase [Marinobacterium sp. xm-g-59]|uniref:O-antigen ligase family protein n=1 Tax=Marinobacterium sp. xm-g-59 TaxID=2497748 RepID=UPI00156A172F|nr:O-antigen ligase family protein [Marinobacterium sp. xm-g-59]NRP94651.1 O-Antigen ligase [Marinobacterium sp. xm-g-59]